MKRVKNTLLAAMVAMFGVVAVAPAGAVLAYNPLDTACTGSQSAVCKNKNEKIEPVIKTITNTLLYAVGILSVIMIIVAGIMYTISGGDSGKVARAKNMLTYSIVGLLVAFIAFALVNWVFNLFK